MSKHLLIINSNYSLYPLSGLMKNITENDYSCLAYSFDEKTNSACPGLTFVKIPKLNPQINFLKSLTFYILFPLHFLAIFFWLFFLKIKNKTQVLISTNWPEKILTLLPAKLLGIKTIWLEYPENNYQNINWILKWYLKLFSQRVLHVCFRKIDKQTLEKTGFKFGLRQINLAINAKQFTRQENIFDSMAKTDKLGRSKKFFTLGTVIDLESKQRLEVVFWAVKKCLTVIPNLQLIVIGDGQERKALSWLAKKMQLDNLVWFVGNQKYLYKWFENLDVYIAACGRTSLSDIHSLLQAGSAKLPIIAQASLNLDDYIINNKNGLLIELDDSESMAQGIIKLKQDRRLRNQLGENSWKKIITEQEIAKQTNKFIEILNI